MPARLRFEAFAVIARVRQAAPAMQNFKQRFKPYLCGLEARDSSVNRRSVYRAETLQVCFIFF